MNHVLIIICILSCVVEISRLTEKNFNILWITENLSPQEEDGGWWMSFTSASASEAKEMMIKW